MRKTDLKPGRNYRLGTSKEVYVYNTCPKTSRDIKSAPNRGTNRYRASLTKGSIVRFEGWVNYQGHRRTADPIFVLVHGDVPTAYYDNNMEFSAKKSGLHFADCGHLNLHGNTGDASDLDIQRDIQITRAEDTKTGLLTEIETFNTEVKHLQAKLKKVDTYLSQLKKYKNTTEAMASLTTQLRANDITTEDFQQEVQLLMNPPELVL